MDSHFDISAGLDRVLATAFLPTSDLYPKPDHLRQLTIHPTSDFGKAIASTLRVAASNALKGAGWSKEAIKAEIARVFDSVNDPVTGNEKTKFIQMVVGKAHIFKVQVKGAWTTPPGPSTLKELLSYDTVRVLQLVGDALVYPADKGGRYRSGVSLKLSQVVVEYPICAAYPFPTDGRTTSAAVQLEEVVDGAGATAALAMDTERA